MLFFTFGFFVKQYLSQVFHQVIVSWYDLKIRRGAQHILFEIKMETALN
jgi:hypothetical protein